MSGREVRAHDLVPFGQGSTYETTQPLERRVCDPVARIEAVPAACHEALLTEQGQVLARVGLGGVSEGAQLLNGALLPEKGLEEGQARGVAERPEAPREEVQRFA